MHRGSGFLPETDCKSNKFSVKNKKKSDFFIIQVKKIVKNDGFSENVSIIS